MHIQLNGGNALPFIVKRNRVHLATGNFPIRVGLRLSVGRNIFKQYWIKIHSPIFVSNFSSLVFQLLVNCQDQGYYKGLGLKFLSVLLLLLCVPTAF